MLTPVSVIPDVDSDGVQGSSIDLHAAWDAPRAAGALGAVGLWVPRELWVMRGLWVLLGMLLGPWGLWVLWGSECHGGSGCC